MFYLGLAAEQDGKAAEAARIWRDLHRQGAGGGAVACSVVRQSLARVERAGAATGRRPGRGPRTWRRRAK